MLLSYSESISMLVCTKIDAIGFAWPMPCLFWLRSSCCAPSTPSVLCAPAETTARFLLANSTSLPVGLSLISVKPRYVFGLRPSPRCPMVWMGVNTSDPCFGPLDFRYPRDESPVLNQDRTRGKSKGRFPHVMPILISRKVQVPASTWLAAFHL